MIGSQMTLSFIENPATLNGVSLVLMAILVFLSAIMRPLKIYRKRKNDFSLYQHSLVEGATLCFMISQIVFVLLGNKPIWTLVL